MAHIVHAVYNEGLSFDIDIDGHTLPVDADASAGGNDRGPRPKNLLLAGLAGCTGMDVAAILQKMKVPYKSFTLDVSADSTAKEPKVFENIKINYIFSGKELDKDKIEKAVKLSQEKYCGVSAMLKKAAEIQWEIIIQDE